MAGQVDQVDEVVADQVDQVLTRVLQSYVPNDANLSVFRMMTQPVSATGPCCTPPG